MTDDRTRERRWVVVASPGAGQEPPQRADGRYVTLGRQSDPTEAEILAIEDSLRDKGLAGYLAVMEGNPWVGPLPRLMKVRPLASPAATFAEAEEACIEGIRRNRDNVRRDA